QCGKVKPRQVALALGAATRTDNALAWSVASEEHAAVSIDVMQSEHARHARDQARVPGKIHGIQIAAEADEGPCAPYLLAIGRPGEALHATPFFAKTLLFAGGIYGRNVSRIVAHQRMIEKGQA